jgi:hypothetical protein
LPHEHSDLAPPALLNSLHGLPMRSFFLALVVATTLLVVWLQVSGREWPLTREFARLLASLLLSVARLSLHVILWSAAQLLLQTLRALALVLAITSFLVLGPWWALVHWFERYGDEPG